MSGSALIEPRQILTLAAKEFRERMRNRWVLAVVLVFTAFSLAIGYFGGAQQGQLGPRSIEFVVASLVSLVIYLVPLIALLLGFDAVVGERERGSLELLLALPLTRLELVLGKYLGLAAALTLSTLAGFALLGGLLWRQFGAAMMSPYLGFVATSVLLGLAFLSLALLLSVLCRERTRASGMAIALWFLFVLVFDLVLLGLLVASGGTASGDWLNTLLAYALLFNPTDLFRIMNLMSLDQLNSSNGLANLVPPALSHISLQLGAMAAWITAPLGLAYWRFRS